jgi:hypothetical protein
VIIFVRVCVPVRPSGLKNDPETGSLTLPRVLFSLFLTSLAARGQWRSFVLLSVPTPLPRSVTTLYWASCCSRPTVTFGLYFFSLRLLYEVMGRKHTFNVLRRGVRTHTFMRCSLSVPRRRREFSSPALRCEGS